MPEMESAAVARGAVTNSSTDDSSESKFLCVRRAVLDLHLRPGAFAVLLALLGRDYRRKFFGLSMDEDLRASYNDLAREAGVSRRTAIREIAYLVERKCIRLDNRDEGSTEARTFEIDPSLIHVPPLRGHARDLNPHEARRRDIAKREPFVRVPILLLGRLRPAELLTWVTLKSFSGPRGIVPGIRTIAERTGLRSETLLGHIDGLQRRGLLRIETGVGGRTNRYHLHTERTIRAAFRLVEAAQ